MTNNERVLLESQAARSSQLAQIEDRAEHDKLGILDAITFGTAKLNATEIFKVHKPSLN
jgi:hypothetical protein